ncbi:MAG TPA: potassium transporter TrkG [Clostridia bacterium]|nr:potassium transporter TrkG [Clostridia bacterium]
MERNKNKFNILPVQKLIFAFSSVILLGAIALTLPIASKTGECVSFIDALFTATSAVCVTGLVVVDTFNTYTIFGQIVIILLIQMGGLGIMTITTAVFLLFGKRITLKERLVLAEQYNMDNLQGMIKLTLGVLLVTLFFEACGTLYCPFALCRFMAWARAFFMEFFIPFLPFVIQALI